MHNTSSPLAGEGRGEGVRLPTSDLEFLFFNDTPSPLAGEGWGEGVRLPTSDLEFLIFMILPLPSRERVGVRGSDF